MYCEDENDKGDSDDRLPLSLVCTEPETEISLLSVLLFLLLVNSAEEDAAYITLLKYYFKIKNIHTVNEVNAA